MEISDDRKVCKIIINLMKAVELMKQLDDKTWVQCQIQWIEAEIKALKDRYIITGDTVEEISKLQKALFQADYYMENRADIAERKKKRYDTNENGYRDRQTAAVRKYTERKRDENGEKICVCKGREKEYQREWYARNREKAYKSHRKWSEKNKNKLSEYQKRYRKENREKYNEYQKQWHRRKRAAMKKAGESHE